MSQEHSALVKSDYDKLPREANRTKDTTFDRIYKYYHNKTKLELTGEEVRIRERWEKAWLLLCRHRTRKQVVELIVKLFNVSESIAYDDVKNTMKLFSNPQNDLKDAKRQIAEAMALKGADKCWKEGDMEGYYKFLSAYERINRLDTDESTGVEGLLKKLKPHTITIVADLSSLKDEAERLREEITKDIEHEEVK